MGEEPLNQKEMGLQLRVCSGPRAGLCSRLSLLAPRTSPLSISTRKSHLLALPHSLCSADFWASSLILDLLSPTDRRRKFQLMKEVMKKSKGAAERPDSLALNLRFLLSPVEYIEDPTHAGWVRGVRFERMRLVTADPAHSAVTTVPSGEFETLPANLVLESIGYMSVALPDLPFDPVRAVVPLVKGKVVKDGRSEYVGGLYVAGWLKRGPIGIIGSNIADASETVGSVVEGLKAEEGERGERSDADMERVREASSGVVVDKEGWRRIDEWERKQGEVQGRGRVKVVHVADMLKIASAH